MNVFSRAPKENDNDNDNDKKSYKASGYNTYIIQHAQYICFWNNGKRKETSREIKEKPTED